MQEGPGRGGGRSASRLRAGLARRGCRGAWEKPRAWPASCGAGMPETGAPRAEAAAPSWPRARRATECREDHGGCGRAPGTGLELPQDSGWAPVTGGHRPVERGPGVRVGSSAQRPQEPLSADQAQLFLANPRARGWREPGTPRKTLGTSRPPAWQCPEDRPRPPNEGLGPATGRRRKAMSTHRRATWGATGVFSSSPSGRAWVRSWGRWGSGPGPQSQGPPQRGCLHCTGPLT